MRSPLNELLSPKWSTDSSKSKKYSCSPYSYENVDFIRAKVVEGSNMCITRRLQQLELVKPQHDEFLFKGHEVSTRWHYTSYDPIN